MVQAPRRTDTPSAEHVHLLVSDIIDSWKLFSGVDAWQDNVRRSTTFWTTDVTLPSTHSAVAILVTITCGVVVGSFTTTASTSKMALPSAMLTLYVSTLCCSDAMAANAYNRRCRDIPVPPVDAATGCTARGCACLASGCAPTAAHGRYSVACGLRYHHDSALTPQGFDPAGTPPRALPFQAQTGFFTFISSTCACLWICRHPWKPWPQPPMSSSLVLLTNTCQPYGICTSSLSGLSSYITRWLPPHS